MVSKRVLFGMLAIATAAAGVGCTSAPTGSSVGPSMRMEIPAQVTENRKTLMVNGSELNFRDLQSHLPKRLSDTDAARLLTTIDTSRIKADQERHVQWSTTFGPGFYTGYRTLGRWWGTPGLRYLGYGGMMFPYHHAGGYWYPFSYATYATPAYWPFLYCYGSLYLPYFYGSYADLSRIRPLPWYGDYADYASGWMNWTYGCGGQGPIGGGCGGAAPAPMPEQPAPMPEQPAPGGKEGQSGPGTGGGYDGGQPGMGGPEQGGAPEQGGTDQGGGGFENTGSGGSTDTGGGY